MKCFQIGRSGCTFQLKECLQTLETAVGKFVLIGLLFLDEKFSYLCLVQIVFASYSCGLCWYFSETDVFGFSAEPSFAAGMCWQQEKIFGNQIMVWWELRYKFFDGIAYFIYAMVDTIVRFHNYDVN